MTVRSTTANVAFAIEVNLDADARERGMLQRS